MRAHFKTLLNAISLFQCLHDFCRLSLKKMICWVTLIKLYLSIETSCWPFVVLYVDSTLSSVLKVCVIEYKRINFQRIQKTNKKTAQNWFPWSVLLLPRVYGLLTTLVFFYRDWQHKQISFYSMFFSRVFIQFLPTFRRTDAIELHFTLFNRFPSLRKTLTCPNWLVICIKVRINYLAKHAFIYGKRHFQSV